MHSCQATDEKSADIVIIQAPWMGGSEDGQNFHSISHPSFHQLLSATTHRPRTLTYVSNTNPYLKASLQPNICKTKTSQLSRYIHPTSNLFSYSTSTTNHPRTMGHSRTLSRES